MSADAIGLYDELAARLDRVWSAEEFPPEVHASYRDDLLGVLGRIGGKRVLEPGCGPGLFSEILRLTGAELVLNDASPKMLARAVHRLPEAGAVVGNIEASDDLFSAGAFHLVVCRDLVHHLRDPIRAFRNWHRWLLPRGTVAVIDAFWQKEDWNGDWAAHVADSPLACAQTTTPLCYFLEQSGFRVRHRSPMWRVNAFFAERRVGNPRAANRYLVVADAIDSTAGA